MANVINFFKFLEDKAGKKLPLKYKALHDPQSITDDDWPTQNTIDLRNTLVTTVPDNLDIQGALNLDNTPVTEVPTNIKTTWYLSFKNTPAAVKYQPYTKRELKKIFPGVKGNVYV